MTDARTDTRRVRLGLVFGGVDAPVVAGLLFAIGERVEFVDSGPTDGVLVIVSQGAVEDDDWLQSVQRHRDDHLVPLVLGAVDDATVPAEVASLNWVRFDPDDLPRTAEMVVMAARTDAARHRVRRALEADALMWELSGRSADALMLDRKRLLSVDEAIATGDPLAQPNESAEAFLAASRIATRRARRRRAWQVTWRVGLVAVAAALTTLLIVNVRDVVARQSVAVGAGDIAGAFAPSIRAVKAASLLMDLPEDSAPGRAAGVMAVEALSEEWATALISPTWDSAINGSVLTTKGVITADGDGTITWWGDDDVADRRVALQDDPLYALTATPDGGTLAASGARTLVAADGTGRIGGSWTLGFAAERLAVSDDGAVIAARGGRQVAVVRDAASPTASAAAAPVDVSGRVLALIPAPRTVLVLALDGAQVRIVDAATGAVVRAWTHTLAADVSGLAVGDYDPALGVGYLAGPGSQLWSFDDDGDEVRPTGLATPAAPALVDVTPQGWVLVGSVEAGVELLFPAEGILYGRVCALIDVPVSVSVSPSGESLACADGDETAVYDLGSLGPVADPGALPREDPAVVRPPTDAPAITDFTPDGDSASLSLAGGRELQLNVPVTAFAESAAGTLVYASGDRVWLLESTVNGPVVAAIGSAPGGGVVTGLEWLADDGVLATTDDGTAWRLRGCAGCLGGDAVIDVVAARQAPCLAPDQLGTLPGGVRDRFGLRECAAAPEPEGH